MHRTIFFIIGLWLSFSTWADSSDQALRKKAENFFATIPEIPEMTKRQEALRVLGERLYHEKSLSINRTQSCASCHSIDNLTGVDNKPTSLGALGKPGDRNTPTVFNAVHQSVQFWDGRAANLQEQAGGPILNPVEMALPDEKTAIERINTLPAYQSLVQAAYGAPKITSYQQITEPLAQYQATLKTDDRFDDWLKGDTKALSALEKQGLETFINVGCVSCHNGALLGGNSFQKMGLVKTYPNQNDQGRYELTKDPKDKMFFKVPMLRNVGRTAPYFHDGSKKTLEDAIKAMSKHQLGRTLEPQQVSAITAFLRSLDDKNAKT